MLAESLVALAAAGGTAVVQAVGTDAWVVMRERLGRLIARGDEGREAAELSRLDQTGHALVAGGQSGNEAIRWESSWQARIEMFLDSLPAPEQGAAAAELTQLVAAVRAARPAPGAVTATDGGVAAGGDVSVQASSGAVAGAVVHVEGGVHGAPFTTGGQQPPGSRSPAR
ncbi:hypothetical protein [Streptomyces sp. V4I2]|uniref:hypothetical protein n=1 Tax=Streptomyces sp. V4I2 TaxID=3042280 RepID=UPI0027D80799|nr:hypothetical protein [Streptomyces sp. V4I2]